jgi:hypothetical protein
LRRRAEAGPQAIYLDENLGTVAYEDRAAGRFDAHLEVRHTVAHECAHLAEPGATEDACDRVADQYLERRPSRVLVYAGATSEGTVWRHGKVWHEGLGAGA